MTVHGILLAAGAGTRMGLPKALVRGDDGEPWLVGGVRSLVEGGCDSVTVVLGACAGPAAALLEQTGTRVVLAEDWAQGMSASLRAGLAALADGDSALVMLVDLPDVGADVVRRLADLGGDASVLARAAYGGRPGHPVLLGRDHWAGVLAGAVGDRGARDYLATHDVVLVECGDLATGHDVDTRPPPTRSGQPAANATVSSLADMEPESASDVAARLGATGYLCDEALATVTYLALKMQRPLLLEGEPGTGKTALAEAIAESLGLPLVRLQCYEGIDATQALYDWDFPRQILHLRALEASGGADVEEAEKSLYDARFLLARPVLSALQQSPAVLLVDEVDRADDEFEAFLLEVLSTYQVTIPELGTIRATTPPIVILTSNRTRELHDALKRRCLYHWIEHPGLEREVEIVRSRAPEVSEALGRQVVGVVQQLRDRNDLQKLPGVAETLDWARALTHLGTAELDLASASATLGALVKYREDADRVRQALDRMLTT